MTDIRSCNRCALPVPPDAPAGLCPKCLLAAGLPGAQTDENPPGDGETCISKPDSPAGVATEADYRAGAPIEVGDRVRYFGDYELLGEIARGGMGVVYRARQVRLNRTVALKMILAGRFAGEADVQRFQTEAEAAAQLDHPGIVPIYEVGEHEGRHFFSMGLVEGESLMARLAAGPLPPQRAAELLCPIAEAVRFAHDRDVIHRDLKPANILLDRDGNPRITDFGLAKRVADDSGLTATGQILGTPGFMAPEQAAGRLHLIGKSADIYALGAILYATITGRPPFQADNPLDTLKQVLEQEPVPPRQLNSAIPRDLETICLKCIQKHPAARYASVSEFAEDLTRFLNDDPIRARRPSSPERLRRWARKRRTSIAVAAVAACVSVAAVVGGWNLWKHYDQAQFGSVVLITDEESAFTARIEDQGQPVGNLFTVPTESPVSLREGSYRLRLSGVAQLSKTYDFDVDAGRQMTWRVGLDDRRLWQPLEHSGDFRILRTGHAAGVIPAPRRGVGPLTDGLRWFDGGSGDLLWTRELLQHDVPGFEPPRRDPEAGSAPMEVRWVHAESPDLNGDGHGDVLIAPRQFPGLLAISGQDGSTLWWHRNELEIPAADGQLRRGFALGRPLVTEVDNDGVADIVMGVMFQQQRYLADEEQRIELPAETGIQALSGQTGRLIWNARVEGALTESEPVLSVNDVPYDTTWFALRNCRHNNRDMLIAHYRISVATTEQITLRALDLRTGAVIGDAVGLPVSMPYYDRYVFPRYIDPDGDGRLALIRMSFESSHLLVNRLSAVDALSGDQLWETAVNLETESPQAPDESHACDWPLAAALTIGSDEQDLLFPVTEDDDSDEKRLGMVCYDGRTGTRTWQQWVFSSHGHFQGAAHINRILPGPDLNGDGVREVFVACGVANRTGWAKNKTWDSTGRPRMEYVSAAALSGADGSILWQQEFDEAFSISDDGGVGPMFWWRSAADEQPLLVIPYRVQRTFHSLVYEGDATAWMLDPSDGSIRHTLRGVGELAVADIDADGLNDLYGIRRGLFRSADPAEASPRNRLYAFRGTPSQPVRRLGNWKLVGDVDADGYDDLACEGRLLSGQTGELLWQIPIPAGRSEQGIPFEQVTAVPAPVSDLDGDGHNDVLYWYSADFRRDGSSLSAVSGRDGRTIWTSDALEVSFIGGSGTLWYGLICACRLVTSEDMDADGHPELVFVDCNSDAEFRIVVLSGRDGSLKWHQPLASRHDWDVALLIKPLLVDLEGSGRCLITAGVGSSADGGMAALRGADGELLWLEPLGGGDVSGESWPALAAQRTADGETVVAACFVDSEREFRVTLLRADNGEILGHTPAPLLAPRDRRPYTASPAFADVDDVAGANPCLCLGIIHSESNVHAPGPVAFSQRLLALDRHGQPLLSFELGQDRWRSWQAALRAADLDGDGDRELIATHQNRVLAFDGSLEQPAWTWTGGEDAELLDVRAGNPDRPATLIVRAAGTVFGLDGTTGLPRWRCDGPGRVLGIIAPQASDRPARIAFTDDSSLVLQDALPATPEGRYVGLTVRN